MFKKYNSIENTYRDEFLERIKTHGFWNDKYVVQEKVHGSNLSFSTVDGEHFVASKRMGLVEKDEFFFNYEKVFQNIEKKLKTIWNLVNNDFNDVKQLTIFGEIFGGYYPHPDVEFNKEAKMVQKGIYYSPNNEFYAFDILLNKETYLDVYQTNKYFETAGLLYAKTIFEGSIEECLSYPNDFNSIIPSMLNLPPLEHNIAEGVVIRPVKTSFFNSGIRVILKNKNEKWAENKKYYNHINTTDKPSEKVVKLQEAIQTYITENRLNNVLSKIGEVKKSDFGKVLGMFNKDIFDDFAKDYSEILNELDKKEIKFITKSIGKTAAKLVKGMVNG